MIRSLRLVPHFARIQFLSSPVVVLLYSLSGALRGAGSAATAMRSLMVANGINMVLGPILIFGVGPFPELGVTGAALATATGRTIGVGYQLFSLHKGQQNAGAGMGRSCVLIRKPLPRL
jgi:Na+-driven multidrug efflux pump